MLDVNIIAAKIHPDIDTVVDFYCSNDKLLMAVKQLGRIVNLISYSSKLNPNSKVANVEYTSLRAFTKAIEKGKIRPDTTCLIINGSLDEILRDSSEKPEALWNKFSSFGFRQIIITGQTANQSEYKKIIDFSLPSMQLFYSKLISSEEMLAKYTQSLFADKFDTDDVVVANIIQFLLRNYSGLSWNVAMQKDYLQYSIETIHNFFSNVDTYQIDYFNYDIDEDICEYIYKDFQTNLLKPLQYQISLVKNNL